MERLTTNLTAKDIGNTLNMLRYIVNNRIKNMVNTILIVKVVAVNGDKIDVQNVIQDLDNNDRPIGNYTIPNVRYFNWQYGTNKIIGTPAVGDIGLLLVSKQDISGLTKDGESIAQTKSVFNVGDGIYFGGLEGINATPTQIVEFGADSLKIKSDKKVVIEAPTVEVTASTSATVKAPTVTVDASSKALVKSAAVYLGNEAGAKAIARDGDQVKSGSTVVGTIVASSTVAKST